MISGGVGVEGRGFDYAIEGKDGELEENAEGGRLLFEAEDDAQRKAAELDLADPLFGPGVFYVFKPEGFELIVKQSEFDAALAQREAFKAAEPQSGYGSAEEMRASLAQFPIYAKYKKDGERGVKWVPVPDGDKDHAGTVYDKAEEESA